MTSEEARDYNSAKHDLIKALCSFQKLKCEYQQQLIREVAGAEAYAAVWKAIHSLKIK